MNKNYLKYLEETLDLFGEIKGTRQSTSAIKAENNEGLDWTPAFYRKELA